MGIVRGELQPGEKLRQDHIARKFGVSHVTVREALLRLAAHGLARSLPRRGMCVSPLDRNTIDELRVMRQALEPAALLHSVPKLTAAQIAEVQDIHAQCEASATAFEWEETNRRFHMAIIAGCGMPRLTEEIHNLQLLYARHFFARHADRWKPRSDPDHGAIIAAIHDRDAVRAGTIMRRHLSRQA
ncbi:GntR family transcriptional regulator [Maritimibacter sp. 55A14]|nr:GntR family transcriptional regulator [Maritimibacter sp. 55A14]